MPIFCQKDIHSQRFCALMSFFQIFVKKPQLLYHILSKKVKKLLRFLFLSAIIENTEKVKFTKFNLHKEGGLGCKKGRVFKINRTVGIYSKYKIPRDSTKYHWGSYFRVPR